MPPYAIVGIVIGTVVTVLSALFVFRAKRCKTGDQSIPSVQPLVNENEAVINFQTDVKKDDFVPEVPTMVLGEGALGLSVRAMYRDSVGDYQPVVLKSIEVPEIIENRELLEKLRLELAMVSMISGHANIVQCHGARFCVENNDSVSVRSSTQSGALTLSQDNFIVEEFVDTSLYSRIQDASPEALPLKVSLKVGYDVACGLEHLHALNIIHCDLHPKNILFEEQSMRAKISDAGSSRCRVKMHLKHGRSSFCSPYWAPEVWGGSRLRGARVTEKTDIFALGVILWECCTGKAPQDCAGGPTRNWRDRRCRRRTQEHPRRFCCSFDALSGAVPEDLFNLMKECMAYNFAKRPTCAEIKKRISQMQGRMILTQAPEEVET